MFDRVSRGFLSQLLYCIYLYLSRCVFLYILWMKSFNWPKCQADRLLIGNLAFALLRSFLYVLRIEASLGRGCASCFAFLLLSSLWVVGVTETPTFEHFGTCCEKDILECFRCTRPKDG